MSHPVHAGGLGFGFKWNMGWMNDTLRYIAQDPIFRRWGHDRLTFGLLYAFAENFILPISHDEVVHGKGSLIGKMPGDEWRRFANARAYFAFMWGHPGKKLLFMGQEFGQTREWSEERSLDWDLLQFWPHAGLSQLVRDLNHLYRAYPALHARDCEADGFQWLVVDDQDNSVFAWLRRGGPDDPPVAVIVNFTPEPRRRLSHRPARAGPLARDPQHRRRPLWRQRAGQFRRGRSCGRTAWRPAGLGADHGAAARRRLPAA